MFAVTPHIREQSLNNLSTITKYPMGIISERFVTSFSECGVNPNGYFAYTKLFLMTPEKKSERVQSTELTKEQINEQFNIATKQLFTWFSYDEIKPSIDNLLLGWIGSSYFELKESNAVKIFDFFNKSTLFFRLADNSINSTNEINIEFFNDIMHSNFEHDYKSVKKYFKHTLNFFLEENIADDNELRNDVLYKIKGLKKYCKTIYRLRQLPCVQNSCN